MNEGAPKDLNDFLQGEYPATRGAIQGIRDLVGEVVGVFAGCFLKEDETWPYQLVSDRPLERPKSFSFSTTAMIIFALSITSGRVRESSLVPAVRQIPDTNGGRSKHLSRTIDDQISRALDRLIRKSHELRSKEDPCPAASLDATRQGPLTTSATFGCDDPLTLSWLVEVMSGLSSEQLSEDRAAYYGRLKTRAELVLKRVLETPDPMSEVLQIDDDERVSHSFPLLRVLQLGETLRRGEANRSLSQAEDLSRVRERLLERIHLHLAESGIRDSQFDAADLVFSLEGWILSSPVQPNLAVVDRVFEVLSESQERTPYWRALRPFKVTKQGLALLPQSIEVANSLLRICYSPNLRSMDYFSKWRGLFDRYSRWLLGRTFRGFVPQEKEKTGFVGWESDHTYTLNSIHLWQTSQALIFLEHYAAMLHQYVAQTALRLAGFRVRVPQHRPNVWKEWMEGEPLTGTDGEKPEGTRYQIYQRISTDFVDPRTKRGSADPSFSMLLYGPPGTGKSTIAEKIADALDFPLITVTPSDFIAGGSEEVEARAKAIFDVLREQSDLVVLFDEIDHLLLDRDSKLYRDQGDVFKLLTPGMLTKLGELSKLRRVLLIVATNYYERIDRAIKRPGRIDERYLVLPPNREQRASKLAEEFAKQEWSALTDDDKKGRRRETYQSKEWSGIPDEIREEIACNTARFTYKELIDLVSYVWKRRRDPRAGELGSLILRSVNERPPMITLEGYGLRLGWQGVNGDARQVPVDTVELPLEEFALVAYVEHDAAKLLPGEPRWIRSTVQTALDSKCIADSRITDELQKALGRAPVGGGQRESK